MTRLWPFAKVYDSRPLVSHRVVVHRWTFWPWMTWGRTWARRRIVLHVSRYWELSPGQTWYWPPVHAGYIAPRWSVLGLWWVRVLKAQLIVSTREP